MKTNKRDRTLKVRSFFIKYLNIQIIIFCDLVINFNFFLIVDFNT